jgi:predicted Zn-dependent protease with MMP-like domain
LIVIFGLIGAWFVVALVRRQIQENRRRDADLDDAALSGIQGDGGAFEEIVDRAVASLPPQIRQWMDNVEIVVEDEPPFGRPLLGLYRGIPLTRRTSWYSFALPDKISIYRGPLERICGGEERCLESRVRRVVLHEIAHHFGISDERLIEIDRY